MTIEDIAQVCHEANLAWCRTHGDFSHRHWSKAPPWQTLSVIAGVRFALAHPDAPDSAQHDAWMADKLGAGWVYGETKDAEAKTHPCLVSFEELPADQRVKDVLFRAVVAALVPLLKAPAPKT